MREFDEVQYINSTRRACGRAWRGRAVKLGLGCGGRRDCLLVDCQDQTTHHRLVSTFVPNLDTEIDKSISLRVVRWQNRRLFYEGGSRLHKYITAAREEPANNTLEKENEIQKVRPDSYPRLSLACSPTYILHELAAVSDQ